MILHYLTFAFRGLNKYKWQNVVCMLGLTIGFSAFALGGYWWYWEHHFDDFHPNAQFTYGITTTGISKAADGTAKELDQLHRDDANWMLENIPEIEKFTHTDWSRLSYTEDGQTVNVMGLAVDSTWKKIENHQSIAKTRFPGEEKNWSFNLRTLPELHLKCRPELKSRFRNIQLLAIVGLLALISSLMSHLVLFIGLQQKQQRRNTMFRSMGVTTTYLFLLSLIDLAIPLVFSIIAFVLLIKSTGSLFIAGMVHKTSKQTPFVLRSLLIAGQVFIGGFFLFVALSLYKQFHFTQTKDRGLRVENIIQIDAGGWSRFDHLTMKDELLRSPYIEDKCW